MSRLSLFICLIGILIISPLMAAEDTIDNIRFGVQGDNTRIVLDMTSKSTYSVDVLPSPPRLIIDVPARLKITERSSNDSTGRVKTIRYGRPTPNTKRIVFDLNAPANIEKDFILPPSGTHKTYRLVVDFSSTGVITTTPQTQIAPPNVVPPKIIDIQPQILLETGQTSAKVLTVTGPIPTPRPSTLSKSATTATKATPYQPIKRKKYLIVIDPGHGGGDPGAIGPGGVQEKKLVLTLAKKIKSHLEKSGRFEVKLTRTADRYIKLRERFQRARDMQANLFISLHADKNHIPSVRGAAVYTLSEKSSDKETARLARSQNNAGVVAGVDLAIEDDAVAGILLDLVRRETLNESKLFAELLVAKFKENNIRRLNNTHRYAGFAVLKAPDIPSVLVEAGFMSNSQDAKLMQTTDYQTRLARAIESTTHSFFDRIERLQGQ